MTQPGNALATTGMPDGYATGLEDFGVEDLKLPRLAINHENGTFKDNLSNMEFPVLEVIPLGAIKQRVLWPTAINDNKDAVPLCKSTDFNTGYPTMSQPHPSDNFPWQATGWNPGDFQPNTEGRVVLPCNSCRLKEWGSHPNDGRKTWCGEQHAIPLLYGPEGSEPGMTALFTAQRSSINASKAFFASIIRRQLPAFAVRAKLILTPQQRGKNKYYVPTFIETGLTDSANWPVYSESLTSIRTFISQPPRLKDDTAQPVNTQQLGAQNQMGQQVIQGQFTNNTWAPGQPTQQPPQQYQPAPQQYAPPAPQPDQWASDPRSQAPVQQYQPAPQAAPPVQQYAPPAPQMPPAPPAAQMPPPPAPVSAPPVASPVTTNAPSPVPAASTARDEDDLPF